MSPYALITKHKVLKNNLNEFSEDEIFQILCAILEFKGTYVPNCINHSKMFVNEFDYFYLVIFISNEKGKSVFVGYIISEINVSFLGFHNCDVSKVIPYFEMIRYSEDSLVIPVIDNSLLCDNPILPYPIRDTYYFDLSHLSHGNVFIGYTE